MKNNSIQLDKSIAGHTAKKFVCPACGKKRFVKFFNFETNEYLDDKFGRCDREEHCGYYQSPFEELKNQPKPERTFKRDPFIEPPIEKINFVKKEIFMQTMKLYESNNLFLYLKKLVPIELLYESFFRYGVGTAKNNGTIFWQIDKFLRIRTGTKIQYDHTGHRIKSIDPIKLFKKSDDYKPCLFGEHLLFTAPDDFIVCLVESEKTALIASMYLPKMKNKTAIWMACSGANGFTDEKIRTLAGLNVMLVPDFSVHARMTWGAIPMRKKRNDKGQLIPAIDGELIEDYVSAAIKLKNIDCNVSIYDPHPEIDDSSDIGDMLVQFNCPEHYDEPDLSSLILNDPNEIKKQPQTSIPLIENSILKPNYNFDTKPLTKHEKAELMTQNPMMKKLIGTFDLVFNKIETWQEK